MRDEMDGRLWEVSHEAFARDVEALVGRLLAALRAGATPRGFRSPARPTPRSAAR